MIGIEQIGFYKKGSGIHIKKKNRGKFTASAKRAGKTVQQHARDILADPSATPLQKKRANFARNAARWSKKQYGGPLDIDRQDNTRVYTPEYFEPIERIFSDGRKYSELTPEEQLNVSLGRDISGRPLEKGLEIVSPEFDVLSLYRSLATLPKGFLSGTGKVPIKEDQYYRQVARKSKGIEDALSSGKIEAKSAVRNTQNTTKRRFILSKTFDVPFFKKGDLWYGKNPKMDVIIGRESPELEWMPITKSGGFRPGVIGQEEAYIRTTPLVNGEPNLAPSSLFEYYRHYPVIGMRNVTNGFPHLPITGISTISEVVDDKKQPDGKISRSVKKHFIGGEVTPFPNYKETINTEWDTDQNWKYTFLDKNREELDKVLSNVAHKRGLLNVLLNEGYVTNMLQSKLKVNSDSVVVARNPVINPGMKANKKLGNFGLDNLSDVSDRLNITGLTTKRPFDNTIAVPGLDSMSLNMAAKAIDMKLNDGKKLLIDKYGNAVHTFFRNNPGSEDRMLYAYYKIPAKFRSRLQKSKTIEDMYNTYIQGGLNKSFQQVDKYSGVINQYFK